MTSAGYTEVVGLLLICPKPTTETMIFMVDVLLVIFCSFVGNIEDKK